MQSSCPKKTGCGRNPADLCSRHPPAYRWKLPKFYFVEVSGDNYLVEDGQQRLNAIWEFFSNELPLNADSAKRFGGRFYRDLSRKLADSFDDFEIAYDVISGATDAELKEFF
jgi:hypothetical protein